MALVNPQRFFDPFDYAGGAREAKRERDAAWRDLKAQGKAPRRSVLRGQTEEYRGLGVPGRGTRDVYGITWRDNAGRRPMKRNARQARFAVELKKLLRRGVPAAQAMKKAWKRVPKNPRKRNYMRIGPGGRPRWHSPATHRRRRNRKKLTRTKARAILHHREARGYELTPAQRGLFGAVASGYRLRDYPGLNVPRALAEVRVDGRRVGFIGMRLTRGRRVGRRNPVIDIRMR